MHPLLIILLLLLASCGTTDRRKVAPVLIYDQGADSVRSLIGDLPMNGENIVRKSIASGPGSSLFLVRIDDREQPHRHTKYDMSVVVVEGSGTFWLNGRNLTMRVGDSAFVPRGTPHYFTNTGSEPAAALVIFSPRFDGPDSEPFDP